MGIRRFILSGTTAAEKIAEISNIIQTYCIPSVFDSYSDGAFYKNGNIVFRWDNSNARFYYNNGGSNFAVMSGEQQYADAYIAVYVAEHGFALELGDLSNPTQSRIGPMVGLDNEGNVVCCGAGNTANNPLEMAIATYYDLSVMTYKYPTGNGTTNVTAFSAIPLFNNLGSYTSNIYALVFRQLTGRAVLFGIDGDEYISNGSIILKDK